MYAGMGTAEEVEQPFKQLISQRVTPFAISLSVKYLTPWTMIPCNVKEMLMGDAFALHAEELRSMFATWRVIDVICTNAFQLRRKDGKLKILRGDASGITNVVYESLHHMNIRSYEVVLESSVAVLAVLLQLPDVTELSVTFTAFNHYNNHFMVLHEVAPRGITRVTLVYHTGFKHNTEELAANHALLKEFVEVRTSLRYLKLVQHEYYEDRCEFHSLRVWTA